MYIRSAGPRHSDPASPRRGDRFQQRMESAVSGVDPAQPGRRVRSGSVRRYRRDQLSSEAGRPALRHGGGGQFQENSSAARAQATYFVTRNDAVQVQLGQVGRGLGDLNRFAYLGTCVASCRAWTLRSSDGPADISTGYGGTVGLQHPIPGARYEFAYTKTDEDKLLTFTVRWPFGPPIYKTPRSVASVRNASFASVITISRGVRPQFPRRGDHRRLAVGDDARRLAELCCLPAGRAADELEPLLARGVADPPTGSLLGPSLTGSTGLWFIPAASVEPVRSLDPGRLVYRSYRTKGIGVSGKGTVAEYFVFGALPRTEITLRLTN